MRDQIGRWPLSVSSDRIAVPALRCSGLLRRLGVLDRSGDGRVFEVYPAAALLVWGLANNRYKGKAHGANRTRLVDSLVVAAPWLTLSDRHRQSCEASDDALDALVCAFVTRAAKLGNVACPSDHQCELARKEGCIVLPQEPLSRAVGIHH